MSRSPTFQSHPTDIELADLGYKDARARGGEVGLRAVPDPIGRILEFTRLDAIFRITDEGLPPIGGPGRKAA